MKNEGERMAFLNIDNICDVEKKIEILLNKLLDFENYEAKYSVEHNKQKLFIAIYNKHTKKFVGGITQEAYERYRDFIHEKLRNVLLTLEHKEMFTDTLLIVDEEKEAERLVNALKELGVKNLNDFEQVYLDFFDALNTYNFCGFNVYLDNLKYRKEYQQYEIMRAMYEFYEKIIQLRYYDVFINVKKHFTSDGI